MGSQEIQVLEEQVQDLQSGNEIFEEDEQAALAMLRLDDLLTNDVVPEQLHIVGNNFEKLLEGIVAGSFDRHMQYIIVNTLRLCIPLISELVVPELCILTQHLSRLPSQHFAAGVKRYASGCLYLVRCGLFRTVAMPRALTPAAQETRRAAHTRPLGAKKDLLNLDSYLLDRPDSLNMPVLFDQDMVQMLIHQRAADVVNQQTSLHAACDGSHANMVADLLAAGALRQTPLHRAAHVGARWPGRRWQTRKQTSCSSGSLDGVDKDYAAKLRRDGIFRDGDEVMRVLISQEKRTALHCAAASGSEVVMPELTEKVPDVPAEEEDVHIDSASKLQTNDDCASLQVLAGGLSKSAAGVGARTHLKAITGLDQVRGTLAGQAEGGKWIVNIDNNESAICGCFREWLDSTQSPGRSCTAVCAMKPTVVTVRYSSGQKIADEILGFNFNEACPMTPFSIAGFSKPGGPAQRKGVFVGWFVDVIALMQLEKFKSLEGEGFGEAPKNLAEIAANIEGFKKRLNALLELSDISLTFYNGLDFQLLPVCAADYKDPISDEISGFNSTGGVPKIDGFCDAGGPAQSAGVRSGRHVSPYETFNLEENKEAVLTPQQLRLWAAVRIASASQEELTRALQR
ncbi:unnamed protein product [Symbiodinium sp. CCMP2592]|nr:unnamed protein product [Symbiodinium sp. CCMP2592]